MPRRQKRNYDKTTGSTEYKTWGVGVVLLQVRQQKGTEALVDLVVRIFFLRIRILHLYSANKTKINWLSVVLYNTCHRYLYLYNTCRT
jgi:uncharacterized membrane protein YecN with MAPEG domain